MKYVINKIEHGQSRDLAIEPMGVYNTMDEAVKGLEGMKKELIEEYIQNADEYDELVAEGDLEPDCLSEDYDLGCLSIVFTECNGFPVSISYMIMPSI